MAIVELCWRLLLPAGFAGQFGQRNFLTAASRVADWGSTATESERHAVEPETGDNVTASGCIFRNITAISGIAQAAAQVCWAEAGGKNTYINCSFNQVASATAAAHAGNRALTIASVGNSFLGWDP